MFCKTIFFCLPAPLRPILSLPWFCCLEGLQHSFGDWGGVELQAWLFSRFPKIPLYSRTAVCCLHMTLYFSKQLGAGVWTVGTPSAVVNAHLLCCPQPGSPAALAGAGAGRSFPTSPGLTSSLHQLPRQETGTGWVLCFASLFQSVSGDFSSGLLAPQTHRSIEDFHESTNHPSLFNSSNRESWFYVPFLPKLWENRNLPDVNLRFSFLWQKFCYKSFWSIAAPSVTWGTQLHPFSAQPRLVCSFKNSPSVYFFIN